MVSLSKLNRIANPTTIVLCFSFFFFHCEKDVTDPLLPEDGPNNETVSVSTDNWWNDAVFYQIFVRSFYDSDGDGIGDLQGIIQKLDYLNDGNPDTNDDLGITGIWLMPIFPSPSYHGYDVTDYTTVNPDYGNLNDFRALIQAAETRGIKIIIDFVGNHTSDQHPWFVASANNDSKRDWYLWQSAKPSYNGPWGQTVWHERNNAYYYGIFWGGMPDLNFKNLEVSNEIKNLIRFWYEDVGVAGFRIDAVKHWIEEGTKQENTQSTLDWWREMYTYQKSINPALMTVGEAWTSTQNIAPYSDARLDYCFEFDLANAIINSVNNNNDFEISAKINEIVKTYPALQYGTFLTNHDQDRSFERFGMNIEKAKMAAALLLSLPGVPYLYYGEEIGMLGKKPDEDIRRPMQWSAEAFAGFSTTSPWHALNFNYIDYNVANQQEDPDSLWRHYQKWIRFRNHYEALQKGNYEPVENTVNNNFTFLRFDAVSVEGVIVVHNLANQTLDTTTLSKNSSSIPQGSYALRNASDDTDLGSLTVTQNGGFNVELNNLNLNTYESLLLVLEKK